MRKLIRQTLAIIFIISIIALAVVPAVMLVIYVSKWFSLLFVLCIMYVVFIADKTADYFSDIFNS